MIRPIDPIMKFGSITQSTNGCPSILPSPQTTDSRSPLRFFAPASFVSYSGKERMFSLSSSASHSSKLPSSQSSATRLRAPMRK